MKVIVDVSIVPLGVGLSLSKYVAECERIFEEAGLQPRMHGYGTNLEGEWGDVLGAIQRCHERLHAMGVPRLSTNLRLGTRTDKAQTLADKIASVESKLAAEGAPGDEPQELVFICRKTCATCKKAVKLLQERGVAFTYRDYDKEPLSVAELREVLGKLGLAPKDVLRKRDKAYKALGLTGEEPDDVLLGHLAANPGLLQRPIAVRGDRAVLGRPVDKLLALVER